MTVTSSKVDWFSIVHMSDVHFVEPTQDQNDMVNGFINFMEYVRTKKISVNAPLKLVCVDGDLTEKIISFNGSTWKHLFNAIVWLGRWCTEHGYILRLMRGTYSHDAEQMANVVPIYDALKLDLNYRYIDKIELEYIPELDLRILYLPDDLPYNNSDEILDVVHDKLRELNWDYVDYAHVHGFFDFTCPEVARSKQKIIYHAEQFSFVRKLVHAGHVHYYDTFENIVSNGNLDNLCFGEKGPKGLIVDVDKGDTVVATHIENPFACPYSTLTFCEVDTTEDIVGTIRAFLNGLKTTRLIHLQILLPDREKVQAVRKYVMLHYPHIRLKIGKVSVKAKDARVHGDTKYITASVPDNAPTPDTIDTYLVQVVDGLTHEDVRWALKE